MVYIIRKQLNLELKKNILRPPSLRTHAQKNCSLPSNEEIGGYKVKKNSEAKLSLAPLEIHNKAPKDQI